ncbi:DUF3093 domain-containing protein [Alteromonas gracilis]
MSTLYSERLHAPLRWWVQVTMFAASIWLACIVALPLWVANLILVLVGGLAAGLLLRWGSAQVAVEPDRLRAGRAVIDLEHVGEVEVLDAEQARHRLGPGADARAFLLTRPYLKRAVVVRIVDPRDPTPYWLLHVRRPQRVADALATARSARPAPAEGDPV